MRRGDDAGIAINLPGGRFIFDVLSPYGSTQRGFAL
jgi:hypothetical protein